MFCVFVDTDIATKPAVKELIDGLVDDNAGRSKRNDMITLSTSLALDE